MEEKAFFDLIRGAKSGSGPMPGGAYLLHGEEEYSKAMAVRQAQCLTEEAARALNTQTLSAPTIQDIMAAAESMPFFDRVHVVTVYDYPGTKDEEKALADYVLKVPESTLLLLVKRDTVKKGCAYLAPLQKEGRVVEFCKYTPQKAGQFIKKRAGERGVAIEPPVVSHILDVVGLDLAGLENAVFRVADYVGEGGRITREAVDACITPNTEYRVFDILTKVLAGDRQEGLRILQGMLNNGESALGIASFMEGRLRQMLAVKQYQKAGMKEQEIVPALGGNPAAARYTIRDAGKLKEAKLCRVLKAFANVDYSVKSGLCTEEDALLSAVMELF